MLSRILIHLKFIINNQHSIYCNSCCKCVHLRCSLICESGFLILSSDSRFCNKCLECIFPFNNIQDDFEFHCCLFNLTSRNKLNDSLSKHSQQLQLTEMSTSKICNCNIDPDKFIFKQFSNFVINIMWKMNSITLYMIFMPNLTFLYQISTHSYELAPINCLHENF